MQTNSSEKINLYFEYISNWILDKTNKENEITSKEVVGERIQQEKQDTQKVQFRIKINGVDIEKSKDIVSVN